MITILVLNYNTSIFVENLLYSLQKLTKNPYKTFVLDNGSKKEDCENLKKCVIKHKNTTVQFSQTKLNGSYAHAEGLNKLVKEVKTPYFSIIDPDACWLKKNWDQILINKINKKTKVVGTQASSFEKPIDFPLVYAIIFETKTFRKLKINFMPGNLAKFEDVGFEIREKYLKAGYAGKNIEVKNTRTYKKGPFKDIIGVSEYYLDQNYNNIFASHFGRGSTQGSTKYLQGFTKYYYSIPLIGKKLLNKKGMTESQKWINICKSIIDSQ